MDIEGIIIMDIPMKEGVSKAGNPWKKKEWVLETTGEYPKKVKFDFFGERAVTNHLEVGKRYQISYDIESREYNGNWYTDIRAYASRALDGAPAPAVAPAVAPAAAAPQQPSFGQPTPQVPTDPFASGANDTDDLPF